LVTKSIDVVLVKADPVMKLPSMRDQKIIRSLRKKYSTFVLGWNTDGTPKEWDNDKSGFKLFNFKAPETAPSRFAYIPFFWIWVLIKLIKYRPRIIHACNLETILPCYIYKTIFRKSLVFDVFDRYAMAYIQLNRSVFFRIFYLVVNWSEENFAKSSDVLINISDEIAKTYSHTPRHSVTIMNCSEDHMTNRIKAEAIGFRILFTGHIRPGRGLEILPDVLKDLKDTQLIITGRIEDRKLLNKINEIPNIRYQGFLDYNEVLDLEASSDVMIALYDLNLRIQNKYVMGNKLFEAMMLGVPIISNVSQELIKELDCGIVVDYHNVDQIRETIIKLRDNPELRKRLGDNGRKAFLEKYNWNKMEQRLYEIYDSMLKSNDCLIPHRHSFKKK
jgi:glycosyltransferase involved in cell wall biosynthesis